MQLTELGKLAREPVIADPDVLVTGGGYTMRIKPEQMRGEPQLQVAKAEERSYKMRTLYNIYRCSFVVGVPVTPTHEKGVQGLPGMDSLPQKLFQE